MVALAVVVIEYADAFVLPVRRDWFCPKCDLKLDVAIDWVVERQGFDSPMEREVARLRSALTEIHRVLQRQMPGSRKKLMGLIERALTGTTLKEGRYSGENAPNLDS